MEREENKIRERKGKKGQDKGGIGREEKGREKRMCEKVLVFTF